MASVHAPDLPLAYLHFGGFGKTAGIISSTRVFNPAQLRNIIFPNETGKAPYQNHIEPREWASIRALHESNMQKLIARVDIPEGNRISRETFLSAIEKTDSIKAFGDLIPGEDDIVQGLADLNSTLHQQIQVSLLAFKAGVSIAADVIEGGYDTHADNDAEQAPLLSNSTDAIDYLWTYAEELGVADRLVVVIASDFGRTPYYNADEGKDHWPIGSFVVMERNAAYTNQVIGETDEGHNAFRLSTNTLQRDDIDGVIIKPAHVHQALRKYLGLALSPISQRFQFFGTEDFGFFT